MKSLKILALLFALLSLGGCATRHGIPIPGAGTSKAEVKEFHKKFDKITEHALKNEIKNVIALTNESQFASPRILVIGYTMTYRKYDSDDFAKVYKDVVKDRKSYGLPTEFDEKWFAQTAAGDTAVEYWNIPLVIHRHMQAFVPRGVEKSIEFPSYFMSSTFGSTGDLVVAVSTKGFGTWILRVLCQKSDPNFSLCEAKYGRGLYQATDGLEIGTNFEPITDGRRIDTSTFLTIAR